MPKKLKTGSSNARNDEEPVPKKLKTDTAAELGDTVDVDVLMAQLAKQQKQDGAAEDDEGEVSGQDIIFILMYVSGKIDGAVLVHKLGHDMREWLLKYGSFPCSDDMKSHIGQVLTNFMFNSLKLSQRKIHRDGKQRKYHIDKLMPYRLGNPCLEKYKTGMWFDLGFEDDEDIEVLKNPSEFSTYKLKLECLIPGFDAKKNIKIFDKSSAKFLN